MLKAVLAGLTQLEHYLIAVLLDESGQQALPVWIEWHNWWPLDDCLRDWRFIQPSCFTLMNNLIAVTGGEPREVCISDSDGDIIHAHITLRANGTAQDVPARANDALTFATVARLPLLMSDKVLQREGVWVPDQIRKNWKPGQILNDGALKWIAQTAMDQHTFSLDQVVEGLYISGVRRRPTLQRLRDEGITHVLKLYHMPVPWPDEFDVLDNALEDGALIPLDALRRGVQFIKKHRDQNEKVLVLCWEGVSRSSTFVLAYLVQELGYDLREAWMLLRQKHAKAWPAHQMWASLIEHYALPYTISDVKQWLVNSANQE